MKSNYRRCSPTSVSVRRSSNKAARSDSFGEKGLPSRHGVCGKRRVKWSWQLLWPACPVEGTCRLRYIPCGRIPTPSNMGKEYSRDGGSANAPGSLVVLARARSVQRTLTAPRAAGVGPPKERRSMCRTRARREDFPQRRDSRGATYDNAAIAGPGIITHVWLTPSRRLSQWRP